MKGVFSLLWFLIVAVGLSAGTVGFAIPIVGLWLLLIFLGAGKRAEKAKASLKSVLMGDEKVIAEAIQHRVFAFFNRRSVLAITSSRIILLRRGLLGGFKMSDIQWKDLLDAKLEQNVLGSLCGSNLVFKHLNGLASTIQMDGAPADTAAKMYGHAQSEEQAWEEKRRVRGMEQLRAASGGVHINSGGGAAPAGGGNRIADEIAKAKALFDTGAVSDAEFQEMKAKIIAGA